MTYMVPGSDGSPNPRWEQIGYPGPLFAEDRPAAPLAPLQPLPIGGDTTLDCDVVVVGSGAGGGVAAAVCAGGVRVLVVDAAPTVRGQLRRRPAARRAGPLPRRRRPSRPTTSRVGLVAGSCLGGGTLVNYTTSFRTPDQVRAEWAGRWGACAFARDGSAQALVAVCVHRRQPGAQQARPARRGPAQGADLARGHADFMPRNVPSASIRAYGYCDHGCATAPSWPALVTWRRPPRARAGECCRHARSRRSQPRRRRGDRRRRHPHARRAPASPIRARPVVCAAGHASTPRALRSGATNAHVSANCGCTRDRVVGRFDESSAKGRDAAGRLLRPVRRPRWRGLRAQVRDGADPAAAAVLLRAVALRRASTSS